MHDLFVENLTFFARGGGGGSGGGGGGGSGGSGGSGGGGGLALLFFIGYFPSYYLGKIIKKLLPRTAELIVSGSFALLSSAALLYFGFFIGFIGEFYMAIIVAGIWSGWHNAFFNVWKSVRTKAKNAKNKLLLAARKDPAWSEELLLNHARTVFMQFQQDWSTFNLAGMQSYLTPDFARHNALMLQILRELGRTNRMENVQIDNSLIVSVADRVDNAKDRFTVVFEASARDQLIDNTSQTPIFTDNSSFTESWRFVRSGSTWLLDHIDQATGDISSTNRMLRDFAARNDMFYSLDMGWLFLPRRGVLFQNGKFGTSDINNHVVGTHHDHLVQFYTYDALGTMTTGTQLIAQINLPKSYGGIIISRDERRTRPPKDYQKYEFEWPDFNARYNVFATDADRLATFELLNPGFMAYLYDTDPGVSIEVTDNIVYLYKPGARVDPADYETMLTILMKAFKELQL
jgi:hypothetical protein